MDFEFDKFDEKFMNMLESKEDHSRILACYNILSQEFRRLLRVRENGRVVLFYENLSQDLSKLHKSKNECNTIIEVGKGTSKKTYTIHSSILCFRCPHLYNELTINNNNTDNTRVIRKPKFSSNVFDYIIRYIYTGVLELREELSVLFELFATANELGIMELTTYLESYFIKNHSPWLRSNFTRVHREVFQYQNLNSLQEYCNKTIASSPEDDPHKYLSDSDFRLNLVLRGSQDGFSVADFWRLCEGKEDIVMVAKVKGTKEIIGGYNPIGWERKQHEKYIETSDSFIFSFSDKKGTTLSRVKNDSKAIYIDKKGSSVYGPCFGTYDLILHDNPKNNAKSYCRKSDYEIPIRENRANFSIEEYEVYELIRKQISGSLNVKLQ
ncbi:15532_t:CDS:2 [Acaulospora morrowiae]|uniref:15532_t:CDS:1 n=1 Tax=Acaulospora morrowiae TaxID=94023 RepID=A0A9N9A150_9GLOM|nr:15532_t:CDS:2 [Acaulospora morrowiae]